MWRELTFFVIAGTVGFVADAGVLYLLIDRGFGYYLGRAISFLCAVWVTWRINRRVTFRVAPGTSQFMEWWRYLLAMSGGGLVNYLSYCAAIILLPRSAWTPLIGVAVGSLAGLAVNFVTARLWVFREARAKAEPDAPSDPRI